MYLGTFLIQCKGERQRNDDGLEDLFENLAVQG